MLAATTGALPAALVALFALLRGSQLAGQRHHRVAILPGRAQRGARVRIGTAHRWATRFIFTSCSPTCWDVSLRQAAA